MAGLRAISCLLFGVGSFPRWGVDFIPWRSNFWGHPVLSGKGKKDGDCRCGVLPQRQLETVSSGSFRPLGTAWPPGGRDVLPAQLSLLPDARCAPGTPEAASFPLVTGAAEAVSWTCMERAIWAAGRVPSQKEGAQGASTPPSPSARLGNSQHQTSVLVSRRPQFSRRVEFLSSIPPSRSKPGDPLPP